MTLESKLAFFKDKEVSLQINLDKGNKPHVHAISIGAWGRYKVVTSSGDTLMEALEKMEELLFGDGEQ